MPLPSLAHSGFELYFTLAPCLSIWETMSGQLESPGLRPFQSLHCSFLCTPADSFSNEPAVSSPLYSTDDSFQGGMKQTRQPRGRLHQDLRLINQLPFWSHHRALKGNLGVALIIVTPGMHCSHIRDWISVLAQGAVLHLFWWLEREATGRMQALSRGKCSW